MLKRLLTDLRQRLATWETPFLLMALAGMFYAQLHIEYTGQAAAFAIMVLLVMRLWDNPIKRKAKRDARFAKEVEANNVKYPSQL